jgi:hypothetical protein
VQTGSFQGGGSLDLIASFTDDQKVLAFAQHLCDVGGSFSSAKPPGPFSVAGFCSRVLHECLILDTEEALPLYLAVRSAIVSVQAGVRSAVPFVWDFRLIRSYYEQRRRLVPDSSPRLLNSELVTYLNELLENALRQPGPNTLDSTTPKDDTLHLRDGSLSIYYDVPIGTDLTTESLSNVGDSMDLS